ncbi:MAG: hypothetical protein IBX57_00390 [Gammaproteobacteria bacterium]|nr:hypothetical protein [Gammaproteobacteria bacterium]
MPIVALEVPETYESIVRPVTVSIVRDLIDTMNLPNDTRVEYTGSAETIAQQGSTLASNTSTPLFPFSGKVKVELVENYLEEGILTTSIKRRDNLPIFADHKLGVYMKPIYTKVQSNITFSYRAPSKHQADRWRDGLRRKSTQAIQLLLHELIYHFSPPDVFHAILRGIWENRESIAGYGEEFEQWLSKCYSDRMTVLANLSGEKGLVSIAEKQIGVQGWFDWMAQPDVPSKESEAGTFEVSFTYTFEYDKVTAMSLEYPIVVHNQFLEDRYLPLEKPYDPYDQPRRPSYTGSLNDAFSVINYNKEQKYRGIVFPEFDDWIPEFEHKKTIPIFTGIVAVDLSDPYQIVDLTNLGDYNFSDKLLSFIASNKVTILNYLASTFLLTFYVNGKPQNPVDIHIDEELNLRSSVALDPRNVHRFRLSMMSDLLTLSKKAKDKMREDPEMTTSIIDAIDQFQKISSATLFNSTSVAMSQTVNTDLTVSLPNPRRTFNSDPTDTVEPTMPRNKVESDLSDKLSDQLKVLGGKLITEDSLNKVISKLRPITDLSKVGKGRGLKTVMTAGIIVHKQGG